MRYFILSILSLCLSVCIDSSGTELKQLEMKTIGVPVKSARLWTWAVMPDSNGKWQYIGQYWNYPYGKESLEPEWLIVDLETGKQKTVTLPGYANTNYVNDDLMRSGNGRLFFGAQGARIHYYDPIDNTIKSLGSMFPNDNRYGSLYRHIQSPDGKIYMGTQSDSGQAGLVQLDPETLKTKSFSKVAGIQRDEKLTYVYYLAADPPWVYLGVGKGRWQLVAFNVETEESKILRDNCSWISFDAKDYGIRASLQEENPETKKKTTAYVWCQDGKLYPEVDGNRPELPGKTIKERFPKFFEDKPVSQAPMVTFSPPDRDGVVKLEVKASIKFKGQTFCGKIKNVQAVDLESLAVLPDGDLIGNGKQYSSFFRYSPKSGKLDCLGTSHVSQPVLVSYDDKIYYSGYPNGSTYVYDPDKPWLSSTSIPPSQASDINPRQLKYLGGDLCSGSHYAYTLTPASNGRLYFLGRLERGHQGSGVAYYDVQSELASGHHKDLNFVSPHNLLIMEDLQRIIISGRLLKDDPNSKATPPEEAKLVVFDMDLKELERLQVKKGLTSTGHLYPALNNDEFIARINHEGVSALYRYNLKDKQLKGWSDVGEPIDNVMIRATDKTYWTIQGNILGKLDPVSLKITKVGKLPKIPTLCLWKDKKLYGTVGSELVEFVVE